jgi:hypothetical protein
MCVLTAVLIGLSFLPSCLLKKCAEAGFTPPNLALEMAVKPLKACENVVTSENNEKLLKEAEGRKKI